MALTVEALRAARARLRGHLVAVPLIGGLRLPGIDGTGDVRLWPEVLQPGGSLWYRGFQHLLLRKLGASKGVVVYGRPDAIVAAAVAGAAARLPVLAFASAAPSGAERAQLEALGCEVRVAGDDAAAAAEQARASHGYLMLGDPATQDHVLGIATAASELAEAMPRDCEAVFVPAPHAPAIEAGLRAAGSETDVVEVARAPVPPAMRSALLAGHRVLAGEGSLSALVRALEAPSGQVRVAILAD